MDDTSEPRRDGGVNWTVWDHQSGDRDPRWYRGRGTSEDAVLSWVNQPSSYERLTGEEKAVIQGWIARELRPSVSRGPNNGLRLSISKI